MISQKMHQDQYWMRQAIHQAKKAFGKTSPNPLVGAVVVKENQLVGKGFHPQAGLLHAERYALKDAGEAAKGATLYVTLEPCSTYGRTPPCTDAIIQAKIARVVIGSLDPNPAHNGVGVKILQQAGIEVETLILKKECDQLNEAFFFWIQKKRPFIILKIGMTLDGKIATEQGQSQWITGEKSRQLVQKLRRWCDAIMVGGETVRLDNPSLTVRTPKSWAHQPQRFIWSRQPIESFSTELKIFIAPPSPIQAIALDTKEEWLSWLQHIGGKGISALLLEGGGQLAASALRAGIVNKIMFFVAPKILGGDLSRNVVGGSSPQKLLEAITLEDMQTKKIGDDLLISAYPKYY